MYFVRTGKKLVFDLDKIGVQKPDLNFTMGFNSQQNMRDFVEVF